MADALDHALLDARHRRAQERGNFKPELLLRVRSEHGQDGLLDRRRVISIKGPLGQGRQLDAEESVDVPEDLGDPAGETPLEQSRGFTMPPGDRLVELCCPGRHVLRTARVDVLHWRRPMSERKLHVERFRYRIGGHVGAAVAMSLVASLQSRVIPYGMRLPRALSPARSPTCELNELRRSLPKFETLHLRYSSHKRSSWQPAKEES